MQNPSLYKSRAMSSARSLCSATHLIIYYKCLRLAPCGRSSSLSCILCLHDSLGPLMRGRLNLPQGTKFTYKSIRSPPKLLGWLLSRRLGSIRNRGPDEYVARHRVTINPDTSEINSLGNVCKMGKDSGSRIMQSFGAWAPLAICLDLNIASWQGRAA
jgi:hypothetical protein